MVQLGNLPTGMLTASVPAVLISGNGAVVVGNGYSPAEPFMWKPEIGGIRRLIDVFAGYGLCPNDLTLTRVTGVSYDGLTIVGHATRTSSGLTEGWIARLASDPPVPPELQVAHSGGAVTLSWAVSADAWKLQATSNLLESNSWTKITNAPIVMDRRTRGVLCFLRFLL